MSCLINPGAILFQLAFIAIHLSTSNSILCKSIKLDTIKFYILAVASFLALFTGVDFRKDSPSDKGFGQHLAPVDEDLKKYETNPNRRNGFTLEMQAEAYAVAAKFDHRTKLPALADGFGMGLCSGNRLSEWAQPDGYPDPHRPQKNHLRPPVCQTMAFVPNDFRGITTTNQRLVGLEIITVPVKTIRKVFPTYKTQKNGDNFQETLHTSNPRTDSLDFVGPLYRSLIRFQALMEKDPLLDPRRTPLSIFWDPVKRKVFNLQARDIEKFMKDLAIKVYQLCPVKDKDELGRWTSHSLCVGLPTFFMLWVSTQWTLSSFCGGDLTPS